MVAQRLVGVRDGCNALGNGVTILQHLDGLVRAADQHRHGDGIGVVGARLVLALQLVGLSGNVLIGFRRQHKAGMVDVDRIGSGIGDDHHRADLRDGEQQCGEGQRQAHAAMRVRIARQLARMQRHARPGEPVHVRHRRVVVFIRVVVLVLLQDREHARRRRMPRLAGGAGRHGDADAVAINIDALVRDRHDDRHRPLGRALRVPGVLAGLHVLEVIGIDLLGLHGAAGDGPGREKSGCREKGAA